MFFTIFFSSLNMAISTRLTLEEIVAVIGPVSLKRGIGWRVESDLTMIGEIMDENGLSSSQYLRTAEEIENAVLGAYEYEHGY